MTKYLVSHPMGILLSYIYYFKLLLILMGILKGELKAAVVKENVHLWLRLGQGKHV